MKQLGQNTKHTGIRSILNILSGRIVKHKFTNSEGNYRSRFFSMVLFIWL